MPAVRLQYRPLPRRDLVVAGGLQKEAFATLTEKTVKTPLGPRRMDIVAEKSGDYVHVEVKLGKSRYLPSQRAKDWWIANVGADIGDGVIRKIPTALVRG
jgi:hypothetical protein